MLDGLSCCEKCSTSAFSAAGSDGRHQNERRLQTTNGRVASSLEDTPRVATGDAHCLFQMGGVFPFSLWLMMREGTKSFLRSTSTFIVTDRRP